MQNTKKIKEIIKEIWEKYPYVKGDPSQPALTQLRLYIDEIFQYLSLQTNSLRRRYKWTSIRKRKTKQRIDVP